MPAIHTLTVDGCDRATAYHMSNKIVRRPDGLFVTWLDSAYRCVLARINAETGAVETAFPLAQGFDNHCGAALANGPEGTLHLMAGSHHYAFIHRSADDPADPARWSLPLAVGYGATYPSLVGDAAGTLHLAYRSYSDPFWSAYYQRLPAGEPWIYRQQLAEMPARGYAFPTNALAVGPDGTLHLVLEFYKTYPNNTTPPHTALVTHVVSPDGGRSWRHSDGRPIHALPIAMEDCAPVRFVPGGNLRPGNLVVLTDGRPAVAIWNAFTGTLELAIRQSDASWTLLDLMPALSEAHPGWFVNAQGHLGLGGDGSLLVVTCLAPEARWAHPASTLHVLRVHPERGVIGSAAVPHLEPDQPDWLPNVEQRPAGVVTDDPYLLYQTGNRGEGCVNASRCRVRLLHLGDVLSRKDTP